MISWTLLKRNMASCVKPFVIIFAVLCMYTVIIIYMYNPELADMLNEYQQALPGMMSAVGMTGIASSLIEWIQIYLYGFIMILFPLIFIIILMQKLLMGYIDRGSLANLLSTPNSRGKIIRTQAISALLWIVIMMAAVTVVGLVSAQSMFPGELDVKSYLLLNADMLLLQAAVTGISFLAACLFSESKYYYAAGAGIPILFFLMQMIANMGDDFKNLKYGTIYTLFNPGAIIKGESVLVESLVLAALAAALFGAGIWRFQRRDLSL